MTKTKVLVYREINIPVNADDWELYHSMPGVGAAARRLTAALKRAFKQPNRQEAWKVMYKALEAEAEFGATDSEPRATAAEALYSAFGE